MLLKNKLCADAGTVNCPCRLAVYGKCIICSRLGAALQTGNARTGEPGSCDCQWQGVCIYNEYLQNNGCINGRQRTARRCRIQKIKWYEEDLVVMRLEVPKGMAEKASLPGSFVFMKAAETEHYFEFPVSVCRADYNQSTLEVAVKATGPKSRALLEKCAALASVETPSNERAVSPSVEKPNDERAASPIGNAKAPGIVCEALGCLDTSPLGNTKVPEVELRGIYTNGLLGVEKLISRDLQNVDHKADESAGCSPVRRRRVLCLTKGVGLAPVANYIRWNGGRDSINLTVDLEKITPEFAQDVLAGCSVESVEYKPLPLELTWAEQEKYDLIVISASDYYQKNIYVPEVKKVISNNASMCCGEGVCGACICTDANGIAHRMCKACAQDIRR